MDHSYAKQKLSLLVRDIANYTDDEFRRQIARIVSGATGQDIPDDCHTIKAERDALAAQIAIVKTAYGNLVGAINDLDDTDTDSEEIIDEIWGQVFSVMQDGWNSFSRNPQQCLAEVKAEAGRAGYLQGHMDAGGINNEWSAKRSERFAEQYAAKIRNTGTWLRDENVNGGKRQGGEK